MNPWRATWLVWKKDLRVELRSREILVTTGFFSVLVAVLASLAFHVDELRAARLAPGVLWIAITFSGVLAMGRTWSREREHEVIRGLLLSPLPRPAIYLGKTAAVATFMTAVQVLLVPVVAVLFHLDLLAVLGPLCALLLLGTIGFAASGTLFASMGVRSSSRELLLSVVIFPLVTPALLCGVVATRELFGGAGLGELLGWMRIMAAYDLLMLVPGALLLETLLSD